MGRIGSTHGDRIERIPARKANRQRATDGEELLPYWRPNQLRHSTATDVRKRFGLEAAQVTLGHAYADVSQIYAERDLNLAAEVMRKIG